MKKILLLLFVVAVGLKSYGQAACSLFPSGLSGLTVTATDTGVTVSWTPAQAGDVFSWSIVDSATNGTVINYSSSTTAVTFNQDNLKANTTYFLTVADNSCFEQTVDTFTTLPLNCHGHSLQPPIIPLAEPCSEGASFGMPNTNVNQTYTFLKNNKPVLTLPGSSSDPVSYNVANSQSSDGAYRVVTSLIGCPTSATDTGNTEYWFYAGVDSLIVTSTTLSSATFRWGTQQSGSSYQWGISTDPLTVPSTLFTTNDTFATATGLAAGTQYFLYLQNLTISGCDNFWDTASFVLSACPAQAPLLTADPTVSVCTPSTLVYVSNLNDVDTYTLYRHGVRDPVFVIYPKSSAQEFIMVDTGAYYIIAKSPCGDSVRSNILHYYKSGISGLGVTHLADTMVSFAFDSLRAGETYHFVVTTDSTDSDNSKVVASGSGQGLADTVYHLTSSTKYWIFVNDTACGGSPDSVSFTTAANLCSQLPQPSVLDNEVSCLDGASFGMDVTYATQSYTFLHAGKPIGGYTNLPGSSTDGISFVVPADQQQYAGIYTVKTWVTGCTDTITLNPTTAYMGGVLNLTISALTDTSVAFHWQTAQAGSQYQWAIGQSPNGPPLGGWNPTTDTFAYARGFAAATTYYIYVTNLTTCEQDYDTLSFTTLAGVVNPCLANPVPAPTIQSSTGSLTVCGGGALLLTSNVATGNYWALNGVLMDSTGASLAVTQSGNYTLIVKNAAGCSDTSAVAVVTLDPGPPIPVLTASGSTTICQGSSVTLNSSSDVGNQWYLNNGAMPGQNGIALIATQGGNYVVQVTDPAGCWAVSSPLTVTVNPIESGSTVTPAITPGGPLLLCTDTAVLLIASSAVNYQWFWDGDALPGENGDSLLVSISGAYSVATGTAGCGSVGSTSSPVQITYVDELVPAVAMQNGVLVSSYATGNQWYLNDSIIRGATHQQFTPQGPGSYTVRVEVGVQAIDTSTFQIGVGGCYSQYSLPYVIADSNLVTPQVLVYPNPMVDVLTLVNKRSGPVTVRIFSMMGQEMGLLANVGGGVTTVNVAGWSKGTYVVFVVDQGTQQTSKVVVVKL